jgi:hypothetical protein
MNRLVNYIPTHHDICFTKCLSFGVKHLDFVYGNNYATTIFLKPSNQKNFFVFFNYHKNDPSLVNDKRKEYFKNETFVFYKSDISTFNTYDDLLKNKKLKSMNKIEIESILSN